MITKENFGGMDIADMLIAAGMVQSKSAGRRAVTDGAIKLNGIRITDPFARIAVVDGEMFILENHK